MSIWDRRRHNSLQEPTRATPARLSSKSRYPYEFEELRLLVGAAVAGWLPRMVE
jgi:hypothetical protein